MEAITTFFAGNGLERDLAVAGLTLLVAWLVFLLTRRLLVAATHQVARRTRFGWDDHLVDAGVFGRLALVAPALVISACAEFLPDYAEIVTRLANVLLLLAGVGVLDRFFTALATIYQERPQASRRPIKGPVQLIKIFIWVLGSVAVLGFALGKSPWGLLSGIGAFTAVLLLVFRDTILSFVAGMQIVMGDLVRKGDWLEVPSFGADGDVVDIALYTVQVQNWDKTIVAIPTFKLMDSGFKNWRGMQETGGRRIKRSLVIDQATVGFVDDTLLQSLERIKLLTPYLDERLAEIERANQESGADTSHPVNGRRLTNLGCFRAYVRLYIENHPMIRNDLTQIVRQLSPTEEGLPLEIYCFTTVTDWVEYEGIQSDLFDHLSASLPWFRLKAYQRNLAPDTRIPDELK